jgi:phosphatidylglycerol:prolipoprotein diacylglycerol transferase
MLVFPAIDPIAIELGPLAIRWYSLAYVVGILGGWWLLKRLDRDKPLLSKEALDDIIVYTILGIILGGRVGYVLFYKLSYYLENPAEILQVWHGGMSFHGGMLGFLIAIWWFAKKYNIGFITLTDRLSVVAPMGLFLGRIANFINGELYGRATDSPLGMVFPNSDGLPRHPSQLYQAGMEGLILFIVVFFLATRTHAKEVTGRLSGVFMLGYGIARSIGECFREPDAQLGFLFAGITMGQLLSLPMILLGLYLLFVYKTKNT